MEKILQIGEGNFLRAFAEYYIQLMKEQGYEDFAVAICQPRKNTKIINSLKKQNGKYHICLKGKYRSKTVDEVKEINCISRCIDTQSELDKLKELFTSDSLEIVISNTTEAGITFNPDDKIENCPNISFPGKVSLLLFERYKAGKRGVVFLPVELIENNGEKLKSTVLEYASLWNFEKDFSEYVNSQCIFCNTLVDRIVTGYIDYKDDECAVACEPYGSWLIQGSDKVRQLFPVDKVSDDVKFVSDLSRYRERKVRVLNGAHTMSVLAGYMCGFDIVRDMVNDKVFGKYINRGLEEVKCTLDFNKNEIDDYANSVLERFSNPFIDHRLLDISLNSISKFKARCLPTIKDYIKINGECPVVLTFSLAALIAFYTHIGTDRDYIVNDDKKNIAFFDAVKDMTPCNAVHKVLSNVSLWGEDLTKLQGFEKSVIDCFLLIYNKGIDYAVRQLVEV